MRLGRLASAVILACSPLFLPAASMGSTYRVLYDFYGNYGLGGPDGGPPAAVPVLDLQGNLYGPAGGGVGNSDLCTGPCGVVYKMTRGAGGSWTESVALNISSYFNESSPNSPLAFDGRGNLYGSIGQGTDSWIFQLTPVRGGWGFGLIYRGYGADVGGVITDEKGNLFGALGMKSGYRTTIGELSPGSNGWRYTDLYATCQEKNCSDGGEPRAPFSWDSKGNLYGTDNAGGYPCPGTNGCGVAFRLTPTSRGTWKYQVLHRFGASKSDGLYPYGGLVLDKSGSAYGTTIDGGPNGHGEVFKLTPSGGGEWKETLVYGFPALKLGAYPWGNLVFDRRGNLYGVANGGNVCGAYYCGEIYELSPRLTGGWSYSVLHSLSGPDGAYPYGVVIDPEGNLFGTAWGGGTYNFGVVFEITP